MARLSLAFLGPVEVNLDAQLLTGFAYDKVRSLLIYLAMEAAHPQPRMVLAELLWPDQPAPMARSNLRQALARLRHALTDKVGSSAFLLVTHESIQFNPAGDYW